MGFTGGSHYRGRNYQPFYALNALSKVIEANSASYNTPYCA